MPRRDPQITTPIRSVQAKAGRPHKEEKWSKVQPILVPGGQGAVWKPRRYDVFAKEAYLTQVVSYRCIDEIAKAVESVEWRLMQRKKSGEINEVADHPVIDLMYRPNPEQTWGDLVYRHTAFALIAGNAYMERLGVDTGPNKGIYRELYSHRPDRMSINISPTSGVRTGYKYLGPQGNSKEWKVDPVSGRSDIWHWKFFHPLNDWYGAGPVEPTAREIDTSNEAMEWNKNLLQNQGRPGMVITFKGNIGDTEYNRLKKNLRDNHSGPRNTGKNLIIEGDGASAVPYGWSPLDMDYINGNQELARRVALGYGVPPMLLGIPGDNTYSNYEAALLAFWENTVFFYTRRFGGGFSMWMFDPKDRMRLEPDLDKIPALEPRRKEQFDKAEGADFLTPNEKRKMCGYQSYAKMLEDVEQEADEVTGEDRPADPANMLYQGAGMMPIDQQNEPAPPPDDSLGGLSDEDLAALAGGGQGAAQGGDQLDETGKPKKKPAAAQEGMQ